YAAITASPGGDGALVLEQPPLARQAAAVADEGAVGADDAVAGDDDGEVVHAVRAGHGPHGGGGVEQPGLLAIAARGAIGDRAENLPDAPLERAAARGRRHGELLQLPGEVVAQFLPDLRQVLMTDGGSDDCRPAARAAALAEPLDRPRQPFSVV